MSVENALPWAMPNETREAIEIMREAAEVIRSTAQFASLRKELRNQLLDQARKLEEMAKLISGDIVDESLMLGIDAVAREKHSLPMTEIMEALENHISKFNRRKA
jgi:uncharacterized SAM-dependent methyltransferase